MKKSFPKFLLINPPQSVIYPQPPLGIAIIAAVLEENGYEVKILDLPAIGFSEERLSEMFSKVKPDVVGITSFTSTINAATLLAKNVKENDADSLVILGGPHGTILPEETLRDNPEIDIIVRGEGEQVMLEIAKVLEEKSPNHLKNISGITYRDNHSVRSNPIGPPILNLDSLPFPAFHLLPLTKYSLHPPFGRRSPAMPIITSRGCPYRCVFCSKSIFGNDYRNNSPDYVISEIQFLNEKFGVEEIKFYDDVFTMNRKWVTDICQRLMKEKIDISWTCETRVNLVDRELLKVMKDAGCYMIAYGVESGDQGILRNLKKDITLDQAFEAFKLTHNAGIESVAYFMIGSPKETPKTIKKTIDFAKKLNPDFAQFSITIPYPGTELYNLAAKEGDILRKWDDYAYAKLGAIDKSAFVTKTLSAQELRAWVKEAYVSFYLRPSYILKKLKKTRSLGELKTNVTGLRMLLETTV